MFSVENLYKTCDPGAGLYCTKWCYKLNIKALWILFYVFPIKAYVKHVTPRMGPYCNMGIIWSNLMEGSTFWYSIPSTKVLCPGAPDEKIIMCSLYKPMEKKWIWSGATFGLDKISRVLLDDATYKVPRLYIDLMVSDNIFSCFPL